MFFSGVKYSRDGEYLISASKDGSVICWSCNSKHRNEKNNIEVSNDSNFTKVASITSTGKHFTDLSILPYKCDRTDLVGDISCDSKVSNNQNRSMNENYENENFGKNVEIETILSASDGSLSYYSVKEKNQKIGDKKGIMKDGKSCVDDNREFKFVLLGSTAVYRTAEDIEI